MQPSVFMIGWEFPPYHSGGLGVACEGLTRALSQDGHQIFFTMPQVLSGGTSFFEETYHFSSSAPDGFTSDVQMQIIRVAADLQPYRRVSAKNSRFLPDDAPSFRDEGMHLVQEAKRYASVVAEVATRHPHEIIHAHDWMGIQAGLAARAATQRPLVLHIHSTEFDRSGGHRPAGPVAAIETAGLEAADKIVAVSDYTKSVLHDVYQIPLDKIEVVHNGIDPNPDYHNKEITAFLADRPVVVFVGRLTIQKGPEYFLAVAKRVLQEEPRAVFVLAGHGDMYQDLLISAAAQQLTGSVLFAGFLRDKEKTLLYRRANVFVMPSVSEPFGISALEAALAETPVIISKQAGVNEVLPHAFPIDFWDVNKMTESILRLIREPRFAAKNGRQMEKDAQKQSWKSAAEKIADIYQHLLKH